MNKLDAMSRIKKSNEYYQKYFVELNGTPNEQTMRRFISNDISRDIENIDIRNEERKLVLMVYEQLGCMGIVLSKESHQEVSLRISKLC